MFKKTILAILIGLAAQQASAIDFAYMPDSHVRMIEMNRRFDVEIPVYQLRYAEIDSTRLTGTRTLDTETGNIYGIGFSMKYMAEEGIVPGIFWEFGYNNVMGNTTYNGYLQGGGSLTPLKETTKNRKNDVVVKIGKALPLGDDNLLTPYFEFNQHTWERRLAPGQSYGYDETYKYQTLGGGLMYQGLWNKDLMWTLNGSIQKMLKGSIKLPTSTDNITATNTPLVKIGGQLTYVVEDGVLLSAGAAWRHWRFDQSKGDGSPFEPDSQSTQYELTFGVGFSF